MCDENTGKANDGDPTQYHVHRYIHLIIMYKEQNDKADESPSAYLEEPISLNPAVHNGQK